MSSSAPSHSLLWLPTSFVHVTDSDFVCKVDSEFPGFVDSNIPFPRGLDLTKLQTKLQLRHHRICLVL